VTMLECQSEEFGSFRIILPGSGALEIRDSEIQHGSINSLDNRLLISIIEGIHVLRSGILCFLWGNSPLGKSQRCIENDGENLTKCYEP
jgi:hypothetical protein